MSGFTKIMLEKRLDRRTGSAPESRTLKSNLMTKSDILSFPPSDMQSFEDAPPPYPGTAPNVVTSKGDYRGVPVYEVGTSSAPVYGQMSYQQSPVMGAAAAAPPAGVQMRTVRFGRDPVHCICPNCRQQVVTRVDYDSGSFAWLMCLLLTVVGCIPCCLIPFCATSCQDLSHVCPSCSAVIGRRQIL